MEHIPQNDVVQISISLYKTVGELTTIKTPPLLFVYRFFNIALSGVCVIPIVLNLLYAEGDMFIKTMEGLITVIHVLLKYTQFLYYKSDIICLLENIKYFWNYCDLNRTTNLKSKIEKTYKYLRTVLNASVAFALFLIGCRLLRPAFSNETAYLLYCWVPDSIILETFELFTQYYFFSMTLAAAFSCDLLYISYSIHIIIQLKLLNHELRHLTVEFSVAKIHRCLKHHQFLHSIFVRMNQVYFWIFLFHYFITLISGCTQLYVIILGNVPFIDLFTTTIYIMAVFIQFGYWSFLAEEIVFELSYISKAIYLSKWYDSDRMVKKLLLTMMMSAQRQKYMSAGGLMDMNVNTFGSAVRKIFSFYAILRNIMH